MKKFKGFTLVEMLTVVAIIAILASIVVVNVNSARMRARDGRRISDIEAIAKAMEMYLYREGGGTSYPDVSGWAYSTETGTSSNWYTLKTELAPYIDPLPEDPTNKDDLKYSVQINSGLDGAILKAKLEVTNPRAAEDACPNDTNNFDVIIGAASC